MLIDPFRTRTDSLEGRSGCDEAERRNESKFRNRHGYQPRPYAGNVYTGKYRQAGRDADDRANRHEY